LVITTNNQGKSIVIKVNIDTKKIEILKNEATENNFNYVLSQESDLLFIKNSSINSPGSLWMVTNKPYKPWIKVYEP